jgi:hypothetical protein
VAAWAASEIFVRQQVLQAAAEQRLVIPVEWKARVFPAAQGEHCAKNIYRSPCCRYFACR